MSVTQKRWSDAVTSHVDRSGGAEAPLPQCTVVVVTYQSAGHLPTLLDNIRSSIAAEQVRVLVVDNASTDDTVAIARATGVEVVETGVNLGYAGALNVASRHIEAEHSVLVLNPDLALEPGAIAELLKAAAGDPRAGIIVPAILDQSGSLFPSLRREPSLLRALVDALLGRRARHLPGRLSEVVWDPAAYARPTRPDWATGAALLITPRCSAAVGAWDDERFFLYSEETDYFRRAREAGLHTLYAPDAHVRHIGGGSGSSSELASLMSVNRIRYFRKFHGAIAAHMFHGIVALHELLRSRQPGHRAALRAVLRPSRWASLPGGRIVRSRGVER